jgi:hypothetical protein
MKELDFFVFSYCIVVWGYIVTFTKVLIIYHNWIHFSNSKKYVNSSKSFYLLWSSLISLKMYSISSSLFTISVQSVLPNLLWWLDLCIFLPYITSFTYLSSRTFVTFFPEPVILFIPCTSPLFMQMPTYPLAFSSGHLSYRRFYDTLLCAGVLFLTRNLVLIKLS